MKSLAIISVSVLLSGCLATVPVSRKFPDIPSILETPCEQLKLVPETDKLSETLVTVTENYSLYYQCSLKVDTWMTWYQQQREIFESVK
jgi:hypothetical protein